MRVDVGGVGIEYDVFGPDDARPVILLHGFPDSSALWRNQVPPLVEAGFRVITPDLRGFGRSDAPDAVESYSLLTSAFDVTAILDDLGIERAHVVGHDFGSALAWVFATFCAERVDHLVPMSVGHPASFRLTGFEQGMASWYILLFQFHDVAERWLRADDWANFRAWSHHPDADGVIGRFEASSSAPSASSLTSALNWYRANITAEAWVAPPLDLPPIQAPTMGIWSTRDFALTEAQMTGSAEHVAGPWRYERVEGPGHWLQLQAPAAVTDLLLDFLPV
ncbi:MAG: alpha/beta hydrolase [Actinomycetota bacterium]|nr:alpha/beta hydrolase [Actinomycetota bacterium]